MSDINDEIDVAWGEYIGGWPIPTSQQVTHVEKEEAPLEPHNILNNPA
jgi:hypothetical protein